MLKVESCAVSKGGARASMGVRTRKVDERGHEQAKASTLPEGEKATPCTHPPEGAGNSPHTVLKGSRSPHTVGVGLYAAAAGHQLGLLGDRASERELTWRRPPS